MNQLSQEKISEYRTAILKAVAESSLCDDGWCAATNLGTLIIKSAGIDYKAMGFEQKTFLKMVFGHELPRRGAYLKWEYYLLDNDLSEEKGDVVITPDRTDTVMLAQSPLAKDYHSLSKNKGSAYSRLLEFAYFPKPNTYGRNGFVFAMQNLAQKTLEEDWFYGKKDPGDFPILRSYFVMTFDRLQSEDAKHENDNSWDKRIKVMKNIDNTFGIPKYDKSKNDYYYNYPEEIVLFNTGLVDRLYEPIYAVFYTNNYGSQPWRFYKFISGSGDDKEHMFLAKLYGDKFPLPAKYYNTTLELVYDVSKPIGSINWGHIIDRCDRLPKIFLEDNCPNEVKGSTEKDGSINYRLLSQKIKDNNRINLRIQNRIQDAIDHSLKRVNWNFKTAIPIYYPGGKSISLLLPLSLSGENNEIDAALVLEAHPTAYIAHTVLTLNMAYANARLITRPDSDWLTPNTISFLEDPNEEIVD